MPHAIEVRGLGKQYRRGERRAPYVSLRDAVADVLSPARRARAVSRPTFWALREVSFDVDRGDVVGIVGRNGAGKSTLLKILARVALPTTGTADLDGQVGSLLEVGTGFHPELTGRDNVYLSGSILGLPAARVRRVFDEIVAFAEVESFMDTPVKHYSSGMYLRLAFAVAAHLDPEILLVDEALAVGDVAFQRKCLAKMHAVASAGRTVLLVSHNLSVVTALCTSALLIDRGRLVQQGAATDVVATYLALIDDLGRVPLRERSDRCGDGFARVTAVRIRSTGPSEVPRSGDGLVVELEYESDRALEGASFMVGIYGPLNQALFRLDSLGAGGLSAELSPRGVLECRTAPLNVSAGRYVVNLAIMMHGSVIDHVEQAATFQVEADDFFGTGSLPPPAEVPCLLPQQWTAMK